MKPTPAVRVAFFALAISWMFFYVMVGVSRLGDPWNHILTSDAFGIPAELEERGLTTFYKSKPEVGWDGQFYYFAANDLLGRSTETASHIDAPSYRYLRIGLPLISKGFSLLAASNWVSPTHYYLTSLLLVVAATWALAKHHQKLGQSPYWALLWALGLGTQMTMNTGLPDAAADALLILAFTSLHSKKVVAYTVFGTLAALTREAYIVFPGFALIISLLLFATDRANKSKHSDHTRILRSSLIAIIIFLAWHTYIRLHFDISPETLAKGIMAPPLEAYWLYLKSGLQGAHLFVHTKAASRQEVIFLALFSLLISAGLFYACKQLHYIRTTAGIAGIAEIAGKNVADIALSLSCIALCLTYMNFGPTVMMHFSGYMKAANILLWCVPIFIFKTKSNKFALILFTCAYMYFGMPPLWDIWIYNPATAMSRYTASGAVTRTEPLPCMESVRIQTSFDSLEWAQTKSKLYTPLLPYNLVVWLNIRNVGTTPIESAHATGSVNIRARLISNSTLRTTTNQRQSMFAHAIKPGESIKVGVPINSASRPGTYQLEVMPIQIGCPGNISHGNIFTHQFVIP